MKKIPIRSLAVLVLLLSMSMGTWGMVSASDTLAKLSFSNETIANQVIIDFFYDPSCESCQAVLPFIRGYETNVSGIQVHYKNIAEDKSSYERFKQIQNNLEDGSIEIPLVIVRNQYLSGKQNIIENLDSLILQIKKTTFVQGSQLTSGVKEPTTSALTTDQIQFFYDPVCESCQRVLPLIQQYAKTHPGTQIGFYDISDPVNHDFLHQIKTRFPNEDIKVPVVFVGDTLLLGEVKITGSFNDTVETFEKSRQNNKDSSSQETVNPKQKDLTLSQTLAHSSTNTKMQNQDIEGAYFFYNPSCGSCQKVFPLVEDYAKNNPKFKIFFNDISTNRTNIELFNSFRNRFSQESIHIPVIFIGDTLLQGEENITNKLNATIEKYQKYPPASSSLNATRPENTNITINPVLLLIAAIGEGLNPCGLLVLALLLVSLMATGTRRTVLYVGMAYICAFFLIRLLSGFAIFSFIQIPGIANAFMIIAGCIAIVAGIIQIKDGLVKEPKPLLSIPESKKAIISSYMKKASIPGGFVVGVLVGIYGMACTAGIYISILGMLYKDPTYGLLYLVIYNFIVIIPLIAILLLVFFGLSPETVNSWRNERKSLLRLVIGFIMVIMGIIILIPMI